VPIKVSTSLAELTRLHRRLAWDPMIAAAVAVLQSKSVNNSAVVRFQVENVQSFDDSELIFEIDLSGVSRRDVTKLKRTHEPARLVEMAAIAIRALAVYHVGGHEIHRVAVSGSGADYVLDRGRFLLEICGRSRRADIEQAWKDRKKRLEESTKRGWYLVAIEFESLTGRITFASRGKLHGNRTNFSE